MYVCVCTHESVRVWSPQESLGFLSTGAAVVCGMPWGYSCLWDTWLVICVLGSKPLYS